MHHEAPDQASAREWRDPDSNRPDDVPGLGTDATTETDAETRTRTGDTTIFSRVLYQLSYLALGGDASAWSGLRGSG